jgi:hypothetical protein
MKRVPVDSSAITSIGYDTEEQTLEVEFSSGTVYRYLRVPAGVATALYDAGSRGKYFGKFIREAGYEYYRVS